MELQDKVSFIYHNTPYTWSRLAKKLDCHFQTLRRIYKGGEEEVNEALQERIDEMYYRAERAKRELEG